VVARLTGRRWHLLTPEHHNFFFDRRTLGRMLDEAGSSARGTARASLYSVSHALYKLGAVGRVSSVRRVSTRLGRVGVPLNLFDIVTVVARRR